MAVTLHTRQSNVSRIEKRTDMYISTLRGVIKATGGDLEIVARFPDGNVRINQFEDIEEAVMGGPIRLRVEMKRFSGVLLLPNWSLLCSSKPLTRQ